MFFTLKLKQYRKLKGLTQDELAAKSGLSQQYIAEIEKNERSKSPTLDTIAKLSLALEVCPYVLVDYDKDKYCKICVSSCTKILLIICLLLHEIPMGFLPIG